MTVTNIAQQNALGSEAHDFRTVRGINRSEQAMLSGLLGAAMWHLFSSDISRLPLLSRWAGLGFGQKQMLLTTDMCSLGRGTHACFGVHILSKGESYVIGQPPVQACHILLWLARSIARMHGPERVLLHGEHSL